MPKNRSIPPEGLLPAGSLTLSQLQDALEHGTVLEAMVQRCDTAHDLHLQLGPVHGIMPREEVSAPWISGAGREISVLSRVGKQICFTVTSLISDEKGAPAAILSRKIVQEQAMGDLLSTLVPGDLLTCKVTRLESFGVFLDIGRGIIALLPLEAISVSRITHPKIRFREGQVIPAVVSAIDPVHHRITLTHKELLGTWLENASRFSPGETVRGTVRSIHEYGSFIELTPNLSGLTDATENLSPGDDVTVYIKSIQPERMKIKLQIIQRLGPETVPRPLSYQRTEGRLDRWCYSPEGCQRAPIVTDFTAPGL